MEISNHDKTDYVKWKDIPDFVRLLEHLGFVTEEDGRIYFNLDNLLNTAHPLLVHINEQLLASATRERITDMFLMDEDLQVLEMPAANIIQEFMPKSTSLAYCKEVIENYLGAEQLRTPEGKLVLKRGRYTLTESGASYSGGGELQTKTVAWHGRPHIFRREDFLNN